MAMAFAGLFGKKKKKRAGGSKPQIERGSVYGLCVLGHGGVGKTALVKQYLFAHFLEDYDPTIEDQYKKNAQVDDISMEVDIVDTAGQEEYAAMRDQYIRDRRCFLLVYSITSRSSFDHLEDFSKQIAKHSEGKMQKTSIVLVGTKVDLELERVVSFDEGVTYARSVFAKHKIRTSFFEASAKERINCVEAFEECVRLLSGMNPNLEAISRSKTKKQMQPIALSTAKPPAYAATTTTSKTAVGSEVEDFTVMHSATAAGKCDDGFVKKSELEKVRKEMQQQIDLLKTELDSLKRQMSARVQ